MLFQADSMHKTTLDDYVGSTIVILRIDDCNFPAPLAYVRACEVGCIVEIR